MILRMSGDFSTVEPSVSSQILPESTGETALAPILVTGMHRSGTTWVGKVLAAASGVTYVWEPLHALGARGTFNVPVEQWYTYICEENESPFLPAFRNTLALRYDLRAELAHVRSPKAFANMCVQAGRFARGRLQKQRPLLKDPFALFSSEWFAHRLGCRVVISVRHPAAVVSSLKRLGWIFDLGHLISQPLLLRDWLDPMRPSLERSIAGDVIESGSLLWRAVYSTVEELARRNPNFIVVRSEDLSRDPVREYKRLYQELGLTFTPSAQREVIRSSNPSNKKETRPAKPIDTRLDSVANLDNWKHRLDPAEVARIRSLTGDVADQFYADGDWS